MPTTRTAPASVNDAFLNGTVFGFDIGTASIGYAVRHGKKFLDVGVWICPEEIADLKGRRGLRRSRRTLRSKKYRRQWLATELEKLGLPKPRQPLHNPIELRCKATKGEKLSPEELHTAIYHLWKRRGYTEVPWANRENKKDSADELGKVRKSISELREQLKKEKCTYLCEFLAKHPQEQRDRPLPRDLLESEFAAIVSKQPTDSPLKRIVKRKFSQSHGDSVEREIPAADWLLYGDTQLKKKNGNVYRVYFKSTESQNPGVLGLRWPRFDNRGPGLDALEPHRRDSQEKKWMPQHTLRRDSLLFKEWQLEVRLQNFTVIRRFPPSGRRKKERIEKFSPPPPAMATLRKMWNERGHLWAEDIREWAKNYECQFELRDPEENLTPKDLSGRARFSRHGMAAIRSAIAKARTNHDAAYEAWEAKFRAKNKNASEEEVANGYARFLSQESAINDGDTDNSYARTIAPPPVLMLPDETKEDALRRYIYSIRDPKVRHRVELFTRELSRLMGLHREGKAPDFIVVELGRALMMNEEQKAKKEEADKKRKQERDNAAQMLRDMGYAPSQENIKKFLLAQEAGWKCPFTLQPFTQSDFSNLTITQLVSAENKPRFVQEASSVFGDLEIEHLVPRTPIVCNEWFNLTVTLRTINAAKRKRTPFQWLSQDRDSVPSDLSWELICRNAAERFGGPTKENPDGSLKYQVFCRHDAASLIEKNAKRSIQQNAYIARCLREASLIIFGKDWLDWTDGVGRDPRLLKENRASNYFLATNGMLTSRLREAWNLNELLHPRLPKDEWEKLTDDEKRDEREKRALKNRQDHRHHAIDAMVISCTLPWAANLTTWAGGWCNLDSENSSITSIRCPVFGENDYGQGIYAAAKEKAALLLQYSAERKTDLLRHHKPHLRRKQAFDTNPYGRREKFGKDEIPQGVVYVARKRLLDLKMSHLNPSSTGGFIFSPLLREHIAKAWKTFCADANNWRKVQLDWLNRFETEKAELETKKDALEAEGKKFMKELKAIRARAARLHQLHEMEKARDWDELLKFIDKEVNPGAEPQPRFPAQFVATLRHPIYNTPIESVKVTAQSKDDASFLKIRCGLCGKKDCQCSASEAAKARSATFVMRKQKDKYREMRVYRLAKPSRAGAYVCWLVLPWYDKLDSRSRRFKKVALKYLPDACKKAAYLQVFRKNDVVCFANDSLSRKGIKTGESWLIERTDAKGDALANIGLLPAHQVSETKHPITGEKVKIESVTVALNDFMRALEKPTTNEPPHPPSAQP